MENKALMDFGYSIGLDCTNVNLDSSQDLKDLIAEKDLVFVKQYLLQKGAKDVVFEKLAKEEKMIVNLKICKRGSSGDKNRQEVYEIVKSMIRDNPLKPGFKTGYKEAAVYLNKHGYRDSNGAKWKSKTLGDFYNHYKNGKTEQRDVKEIASSNKSKSYKTHGVHDLVGAILDSNLADSLKLKLIPLVIR